MVGLSTLDAPMVGAPMIGQIADLANFTMESAKSETLPIVGSVGTRRETRVKVRGGCQSLRTLSVCRLANGLALVASHIGRYACLVLCRLDWLSTTMILSQSKPE